MILTASPISTDTQGPQAAGSARRGAAKAAPANAFAADLNARMTNQPHQTPDKATVVPPSSQPAVCADADHLQDTPDLAAIGLTDMASLATDRPAAFPQPTLDAASQQPDQTDHSQTDAAQGQPAPQPDPMPDNTDSTDSTDKAPAPQTAPATDLSVLSPAATQHRPDRTPTSTPELPPATALPDTAQPDSAATALTKPDTAPPLSAPPATTGPSGTQPGTQASTQPSTVPPPASAPISVTQSGWPAAIAGTTIEALTPQGGTLILNLSPDDLGPLRITLTIEGDTATVRILTDTAEAARILSDAERQLAAEFARNGLTLTGHDASHGNHHDNRTAATDSAQPPETDTQPQPETDPLHHHAGGAVNLIA